MVVRIMLNLPWRKVLYMTALEKKILGAVGATTLEITLQEVYRST